MTTIQEAIEKYEEETGDDSAAAKRVMLCGQMPPIQKLDKSIGKLASCEHLGLSSNNIEKICFLGRLSQLKILSIGRNQIKKLDGLEEIAATLEQLWMSYNLLDKLNGVEKLVNLKVFYLSNNLISKWTEVDRLKNCPALEEVLLQANPVETNLKRKEDYRLHFVGRANQVKKFDGVPIDEEEREIGVQFVLGQRLLSRFGNLSTVFKKLDANGDGSLTRDEMANAIRNFGFPYEEEELDAFLKGADSDGNGKIQYQELCARFTDLNVAADDKG